MSTDPLSGRVALVTGANHGIGRATAVELARLGADVFVTYLSFQPNDEDPGRPDQYAIDRRGDASSVLTLIESIGRNAEAIEADLSDPSSITRIFDRAAQRFGPIDILVHNASSWLKDSFGDGEADHLGRALHPVTAESFDKQFAVDARAGALLISEFCGRLRQISGSWGRIITLTSGGPNGFPGEVSYGAAKAALVNYTMSAATELASLGVTANVVYPPVTDTGWITPEVERFVAESPDHFHIASPDEVAGVIGWLCTDAARLVSGTTLRLR